MCALGKPDSRWLTEGKIPTRPRPHQHKSLLSQKYSASSDSPSKQLDRKALREWTQYYCSNRNKYNVHAREFPSDPESRQKRPRQEDIGMPESLALPVHSAHILCLALQVTLLHNYKLVDHATEL